MIKGSVERTVLVRERARERVGGRKIYAEERYMENRWQVEEPRSHLHIVCRMLQVYRTELPPFLRSCLHGASLPLANPAPTSPSLLARSLARALVHARD